MKLEKRIEYLSLALGNAKSHQVSEFDTTRQAPVEFLTDLDEKLEVANVQLEIYEIMKGMEDLGKDDRKELELLGTALLDITTVGIDRYPNSSTADDLLVQSSTTDMQNLIISMI